MVLVIVAYLGGILTILSPCILPVLPFIFASAGQPFLRTTVPMLAGMAISFCIVGSLAAVGGNWAIEANQYGRATAFILLGVFGLCLLSPPLTAMISDPATRLGNWLARATYGSTSIAGSIAVGVATGLLWTPCAGPILGLVLTGAALQGANGQTFLLLLAYAAGAATSLGLAVAAGGRVLPLLRQTLGSGEIIRRITGMAILAGVAVIGLGLDVGLLARLSYASTNLLEQKLISRFTPNSAMADEMTFAERTATKPVVSPRQFQSDLPLLGTAPSISGAVEWLNSEPLSIESLRGKVVLVDFWTYSCINCIRTMPYVRAWAERYRDMGLVDIGVHAPEFAFEKKIENVKKAIGDFNIGYPVAIDNNYKIWRAFDNRYWPAHYLIDASGRIRYIHFGEGNYEHTEQAIRDLLREAGQSAASQVAGQTARPPKAVGAEAAADLANIGSEETYIGYQRSSGFASPERIRANSAGHYSVSDLRLNQWGLRGEWTIGAEHATLAQKEGGIAYRFSARDLHLVLGPGVNTKPIRFRVTIDGKPPGLDRGADIDAEGYGTISTTRLYQLVRQAGPVTTRTFEIRFLDEGAEAYAFTFG